MRMSETEPTGLVQALSDGNGPMRPVRIVDPVHYLHAADHRTNSVWHRVPARLNLHWYFALAQHGRVSLDAFAAMVPTGFRQPGNAAYYAITHAPRESGHAIDSERVVQAPEFAVWRVSADGAWPVDVEVEGDRTGVALLEPHWPADILGGLRILVVGAGSIGGSSALALATAGVGTLHLLDPDRLRWHNLPRHVCGRRHVGRLKVEALRADLEITRSDTHVDTHPHDVVYDADLVRDLLAEIDVVVCAADGVLPRRVVSHIARRAGVPTILACVLADGAYGDVVRLLPWRDHGCLQCRNEALTESGGLMPDLNRGSGYAANSNAMTAVGSDLHLVGQLAAKMAVATHLQSQGHHDQWFAGEHAVLALRPAPGWAPPYNLSRAGEVEWHPATPPRPGCPTCG